MTHLIHPVFVSNADGKCPIGLVSISKPFAFYFKYYAGTQRCGGFVRTFFLILDCNHFTFHFVTTLFFFYRDSTQLCTCLHWENRHKNGCTFIWKISCFNNAVDKSIIFYKRFSFFQNLSNHIQPAFCRSALFLLSVEPMAYFYV